jgi:hypothetical protein
MIPDIQQVEDLHKWAISQGRHIDEDGADIPVVCAFAMAHNTKTGATTTCLHGHGVILSVMIAEMIAREGPAFAAEVLNRVTMAFMKGVEDSTDPERN